MATQGPDEFEQYPEPVRGLMRELAENPDALSLMRSLCVIPDVRDLSYDIRRTRLAPDSVVQQLIYEAIDDVSYRDQLVELLMKDYVPPDWETWG